jgi:predicted transposase YbfD/YdcC
LAKRKEKGRLNVYTKSENNGDEKVCFITSLDIDEKSANQYAESFRRRWGIETSYRVEDDFKPKKNINETCDSFILFPLLCLCV